MMIMLLTGCVYILVQVIIIPTEHSCVTDTSEHLNKDFNRYAARGPVFVRVQLLWLMLVFDFPVDLSHLPFVYPLT